MASPFIPPDLSARRAAASQLRQQASSRSEAQAAGGVQLGGTLLGALIGTLATGMNPAGAAAGAAIGGGLAGAAAPLIAPGQAQPGQAAAGIAGSLQGIDRLTELIRRYKAEQAAPQQVKL